MGLLNDLHELKVRDAEVLIEARSNLFFTEQNSVLLHV